MIKLILENLVFSIIVTLIQMQIVKYFVGPYFYWAFIILILLNLITLVSLRCFHRHDYKRMMETNV